MVLTLKVKMSTQAVWTPLPNEDQPCSNFEINAIHTYVTQS